MSHPHLQWVGHLADYQPLLLSIASEDEEEEVMPNNVWDHAIDTLFKLSTLHSDGKSLRDWVNIKTWTTWNSFINGMRDTWQ